MAGCVYVRKIEMDQKRTINVTKTVEKSKLIRQEIKMLYFLFKSYIFLYISYGSIQRFHYYVQWGQKVIKYKMP